MLRMVKASRDFNWEIESMVIIEEVYELKSLMLRSKWTYKHKCTHIVPVVECCVQCLCDCIRDAGWTNLALSETSEHTHTHTHTQEPLTFMGVLSLFSCRHMCHFGWNTLVLFPGGFWVNAVQCALVHCHQLYMKIFDLIHT